MANKNATWILQALDRHEASLLRYGARLLGDHDAARDLVQETFLELCKTKRSKVEGHLAAWLFRVCRNRALDLRRKENRVQPLSEAQSETIESPEPSPLVLVEKTRGAESLVAQVKKLPESQQEVVFLRFHAGLSYKEISKVTGHSVSHVGVLIHTAVGSIRDQLARRRHSDKALEGAL